MNRRVLWQKVGQALFWLTWPGIWLVVRLSGPRTRVLVLAEDSVLLVQGFLSDGRWGLPGGGVHHGELLLAGAVREVREETGLRFEAGQLTYLGSEWCSGGIKFYSHFYSVHLPNQTQPQTRRGEILAARWLPLADLPNLPHKPEIDRALRLLGR